MILCALTRRLSAKTHHVFRTSPSRYADMLWRPARDSRLLQQFTTVPDSGDTAPEQRAFMPAQTLFRRTRVPSVSREPEREINPLAVVCICVHGHLQSANTLSFVRDLRYYFHELDARDCRSSASLSARRCFLLTNFFFSWLHFAQKTPSSPPPPPCPLPHRYPSMCVLLLCIGRIRRVICMVCAVRFCLFSSPTRSLALS